jgi:ribosomal-protein-alanine N-acetyltransferase
MNQHFHFQKALPADIAQIVDLEKLCFGIEGFSKNQINYLVSKAKGEVVVVKISSEIVASLILLYRKNSENLRIYSLVVSTEMRGKGLAKEMIFYSEKKAKSLGLKKLSLEVSENNQAAISLYQNAGFTIFQTKTQYYKDGSGALVMRKSV